MYNVGYLFVADKNAAPKANAGGDQTVVLPVSVVAINGSQSLDDLRVAKWQWERQPTGLAAGNVVGDTHTQPVLLVITLHVFFISTNCNDWSCIWHKQWEPEYYRECSPTYYIRKLFMLLKMLVWELIVGIPRSNVPNGVTGKIASQYYIQ